MRRPKKHLFLLLFVLAGVLTACAPAGENTPAPAVPSPTAKPIRANSGIEGQVWIGPACPGPVRQGDTKCADKPYQAEIVVLDLKGVEVVRTTSGEDGAFRVDLPPGRYTLHPIPGKPFPSTRDQEVEVTPGAYTRVVVNYDSGMR
jgi:hypothetical protein